MSNFLMDNTALFMGLVSLPFGHEIEFYEEEFEKGIFKNYKESVKKHFSSSSFPLELSESNFEKYLYTPAAYYLFGSFDMAVFSLIDDFEFICRQFYPFNPMSSKKNGEYLKNFKYQVVSGLYPNFNESIDGLKERATKTFLSKEKPPLIGICSLKLNNSLLIGSGMELMKNVMYFINYTTDQFLKTNNFNNTQIITLISYSWHEIFILVFSDSYKKICQLILNIREKKLKDIEEVNIPDFNSSAFFIKNHSLNANLIDLSDSEELDINQTHLFENTTSVFGLDFEIFKQFKEKGKVDSKIVEKIPDEDIEIFTRWFTRPGHLQDAVNLIHGENPDIVSICIGRGDITYPFYKVKEKQQNAAEYISDMINTVQKQNINKHITQSYSIFNIPLKKSEISLQSVDKNHFYFLENIPKLQYDVDEVERIQQRLQELGTPKVLKAKIMNIISNYNDGILDTILYGYFFELSGMIKTLIKHIDEIFDTDPYKNLTEQNKFLELITNDFEKAYLNRFHQSYRMSEITDHTLDYKGGIHQLASCFDATFKTICSIYGNKNSFAYISSAPYVLTNQFSIRLNYFHIFQPEIFVAIASHEVANFIPFEEFEKKYKIEFITLKKIFTKSKFDEKDFSTNLKTGKLFWEEESFNQNDQKELNSVLKSLEKNDSIDLKSFITTKYFRYILADLISFHFTFQQNIELFLYWSWNIFMQIPDAYETREKIDEDQFKGFLLRYLSVLKLSDIIFETSFPDSPINSLNPEWKKWIIIVSEFLDGIFEISRISSLLTEMKNLIDFLYDKAYVNSKSNNKPSINKKGFNEVIINHSIEIKNHIRKGEIFEFKLKNIHQFQFTQATFYAYLSLIKEIGGNGETVLKRDKKGNPICPNESYAKFLFDPTGGIFTHDPEIRGEYLKYRTALTLTLWDMGMKIKRREIAIEISNKIHKMEYKYIITIWNKRYILTSKKEDEIHIYLKQVDDYFSCILKNIQVEKTPVNNIEYLTYLLWGRIYEIYSENCEEEQRIKLQKFVKEKYENSEKLDESRWDRREIDLRTFEQMGLVKKHDKKNPIYSFIYSE